tara:strand:- start:863 stop:1186 length:324 start_codon:yes stop_codon:yes gene_type:complete
MATISNEQLNELVNLGEIRFYDNKVDLSYDDDTFLLQATYDGRADEVTQLDFYVQDIGLALTLQQEDIVGLHLENSYNNRLELKEELRQEFLEDMKFEQFKDNKNGI